MPANFGARPARVPPSSKTSWRSIKLQAPRLAGDRAPGRAGRFYVGATQELSLGTAAIVHLGAVARVLDYPSDSTGPRLYEQDITQQPIRFEAGHLLVPSEPGLGTTVDETRVESLTAQSRWTFGTDLNAAADRVPARRPVSSEVQRSP
jgi:enolase-like protein